MLRIGLFLITNIAVMVVFGVVLSLFGVEGQSLTGLLIFSALFGFGGSFISLLLSKTFALYSVGADIIQTPKTAHEKWLFRVVERHAKSVDIATPDIAIYEAADINAFATGARKNHSLVAVSSGLLTSMTENEAEAVIAHEISHIANGDMVTMALLQGVLNTFVIFISRMLARLISHLMAERNRDVGQVSYFVIVMLLELVFGMLASLIVMWFSRLREYRADAGSAELVGCDKMIAALKRLKQSSAPKENASIAAFCINGGKRAFSELFLSHPSLDKRIEALQHQN